MPIAYFTTRGTTLPVHEVVASAEDFYAVFGLDGDATHIADGNAADVAFAAAQPPIASSSRTRPNSPGNGG